MQSQENFSPLLELPNTYRAFYGGFSHLNSIQKQTILPILKAKDIVLSLDGVKEPFNLKDVDSKIVESLSEGGIYYSDTKYHINNLRMLLNNKECLSDSKYKVQSKTFLKILLDKGYKFNKVKEL